MVEHVSFEVEVGSFPSLRSIDGDYLIKVDRDTGRALELEPLRVRRNRPLGDVNLDALVGSEYVFETVDVTEDEVLPKFEVTQVDRTSGEALATYETESRPLALAGNQLWLKNLEAVQISTVQKTS